MFCENCGSKLLEGANFCVSCDTPVSVANANPEPDTVTEQTELVEPDVVTEQAEHLKNPHCANRNSLHY